MRCMTSLKKNIKYIAVVIILILISGTLYLGAIRIYELEKKVTSQEYMIYELEGRLDDVKKLADHTYNLLKLTNSRIRDLEGIN